MDCESNSDEETYLPAILNRPKVANYIVHERVTVDTRDHEDHTFSGVMFDVTCKETLPVAFLEISSVSVRGDLGPMTVWFTPGSFHGKHEAEEQWKLVYSRKHAPSHVDLVALELDEPVRLRPGETVGLYVHSRLPGDTGIVYDEQRAPHTYNSDLFCIHPGWAHISNRPFGQRGQWGHPWRQKREFVGRLAVGMGWQLWNPEIHSLFPVPFRRAAMCLFLCASRRTSPLHCLSDAVLMYILNMCRWDWFGGLQAGAPASGHAAGARAAHAGRGMIGNAGAFMFGGLRFGHWGARSDDHDDDEDHFWAPASDDDDNEDLLGASNDSDSDSSSPLFE